MRIGTIVLVVIALFLGNLSFFVVQEGQKGMVLHLGALKTEDTSDNVAIYGPGLHFKVPFVDHDVLKFDARIQVLDGDVERIVSSENKGLLVDSYVKWQIIDFVKFYKSTQGDFRRARFLLDKKVDNYVRTAFGSRTIREVVSGERDKLIEELIVATKKEAKELGMDVIDVRIKRINLPDEVSANVYERMRTDRLRVATKHRSEGEEQAEIIRAQTDATVTITLANARKQAEIIRGQGDAEATRIYAEAYGKDPEFYGFLKSLDAYKAAFKDKKDVLVLSPEGEFFKYMKSPAH